MNDEMNENKFKLPEFLTIIRICPDAMHQLSEIRDHLNNLLEWLEHEEEFENNNDYKLLVMLISLIIDKTKCIEDNLDYIREFFPCMPVDQWEIFQNRFDEFIKEMPPLKLNKK